MEETRLSFDVAITKTELFDVEKMQWLLRSDKLSKEDKFKLSKYYKRKHNINQVGVVYQLGEKSKFTIVPLFVSVSRFVCHLEKCARIVCMKYGRHFFRLNGLE